jgi:hypothetical protein
MADTDGNGDNLFFVGYSPNAGAGLTILFPRTRLNYLPPMERGLMCRKYLKRSVRSTANIP